MLFILFSENHNVLVISGVYTNHIIQNVKVLRFLIHQVFHLGLI